MKQLGKRVLPILLTICMVVSAAMTPFWQLPVHAAEVEEEITDFKTDGAVDGEISEEPNSTKSSNEEITKETLPQPIADVVENITAVVDGTSYAGESLSGIITGNSLDAAWILSLKIERGTVTQEDLGYLKELTNLESFEMNLGENLSLTGKDGNPTTVLSEETAVLEFAPQPANSSKPNIRTAVLGGITEIQSKGLIGGSLEEVQLPDVITVGDSVFSAGFAWLETLDLSSAETIGSNAFNGCTRLRNLTMNAVESLGDSSFKYTDALTKLTLPETIKTIGTIDFGKTRSGNKSGTKIVMESMAPPTVATGAFSGVSSLTYQSTVTVPQGALAAYVAQINANADAAGVLARKDTIWNNLYLKEAGSSRIEYYSPNSWEIQYAFVKEGEALTAEKIAKLEKEGFTLSWNTKNDGSGDVFDVGTIPAGEMTVYPQWSERQENITAVVDGTSYAGESLSGIITGNRLDAAGILSLKIERGTVTQEDLGYLKELTNLESFEMNLGENLSLTGKDGNPTTVLSVETAVVEFAPQPANSSKPNIRTAVLGGITEIQSKGLVGGSLEEVQLPDVITVGDSAFSAGFAWLETLDLSSAETIGDNAFNGCTRLRNLTMNAVESLGDGSFKYTDALTKLTLPETIKTIGTIDFGKTRSGNKSGTKIVMESMVPPTVATGAFSGVSSLTYQSTVTVPQGALAAYVAQINANADAAGVLARKDTIWNNLYLKEAGSSRIEYYSPNSWEVQYAFVKEGEALTAEKIAKLEKEGFTLSWNTKNDGSGDIFGVGSVPAGEMTVYPQWSERQENITAVVDGTSYAGESLSGIITGNSLDAAGILSLKIERGTVTQEDLGYLKELTNLESFEMNLGENLSLTGKDGNPTTVLSAETAVVEFAPQPANSSKPNIRTAVLGGITEIQSKGLIGGSLEEVQLPDVITVGDSAFSAGFAWLETLDLSSAETIGSNAFNGCTRLRNLTMNAVESLGDGSFKYTDALTKLTLPETIKTIGTIDFGKTRSGNKSGTKIVMESMVPPTVATGAFSGVSSLTYQSTVTVPQDALAAYVAQVNALADVSGVMVRKDTIWNNLYLKEAGSNRIEYYSPNSWEVQYAFVKEGETLTAEKLAKPKKDGYILTGWNTKADGSGTMVGIGTTPTGEMTVYPQWRERQENITAVVDGTSYAGENLADLITYNKLDAAAVLSLSIESGTVTQEDLSYLKELTNLTSFEMNLGENLSLTGKDGNPTTVLGAETAVLEFAPQPANSSKPNIRTAVLGGITEIQSKGLIGGSLEEVQLPDVITVGDSAFSAGFAWLETLDLSSAETIGSNAFNGCTRLRNLTMNAVESLGDSSFKYTDALTKLTLPETIKTIGTIDFGKTRSGNKSGTKIVMESMVPPTVATGAFSGVSSLTYQSTVTVPQGALAAYVAQINANADAAGVLARKDTIWNNLYLKEAGSSRIEYYSSNSWEIQYAFVKEGEALTAEKIAKLEKEGFTLSWNTKNDGSGDIFGVGSVPAGEMTVYPQWRERQENITAVVDGTSYAGENLADLITYNKLDTAAVLSLTIESGIVTQEDLSYLKELTNLTSFEMNLGENLSLTGKDGNPTTVLSAETAVVEFAPQPANSSKPNIRTAVLGGITEIQSKGLIGGSLEEVQLPDVITVGDSAFSDGFAWLETLDLSSAKTIGNDAFNGCTRLRNLTMNAVESLGDSSFKYTDALTKLTLPETIKTIGTIDFGKTRSGNKSGTKIVMESMVPPTVATGAFSGVSSLTYQSTVTVPQGALAAYVAQINANADAAGVLARKDTIWNNLYLKEAGSSRIEYYSPNSWEIQYAFVKEGEALTAEQIAVLEKDDLVLSWNTKKDGSGDAFGVGTIPAGEMTVYPQWRERQENITAVVDGTSYAGENLADLITYNKLDAAAVLSLTIESGTVTQEDLSYLKELTNLASFEMNLGENLSLTGKDGNTTTVLGAETAVLEFAPQPANSSKPNIRTAVLGGITEIQSKGLIGGSLEEVQLPDVITVGDSAFSAGFTWLETLDLSSAETIGSNAFNGCTRLRNLTMNAVESLGDSSFKYTDALTKLTLPETIKTIGTIDFGKTRSGNKSGTKIVMESMVPPTVATGAFSGVSSLTYQSTVTVPQGALAAYVAQINANADAAGVLARKDTIWNNLYLKEAGSSRIEYYSPNSWEVQYAFVKEGEALTEGKIAKLEKENHIMSWNTKKDGRGETVGAGTIPAGDMTVYPIYVEVVTVTFSVDGENIQTVVVKGEAIGDKLQTAPEKEGYTFREWNTSADGNGEAVTAQTIANADMTVYPIYDKIVIPAVMNKVKAENGTVTIELREKPTTAPVQADFKLQMNLDGKGNKDIAITGFTYNDDRIVVLSFDAVAQSTQQQTFILTVALGEQTLTSEEITVPAKPVDKTVLDAAIRAAIPEADKDQYTETSWTKYAEALEAAKDVQADKDATQKIVDDAVKALEDARKALVKIDKTALDEAIKAAIPDSEKDNYTQSSWTKYTEALKAAKDVQADKDAVQQEIDEAVKVLKDAKKALVKIDKTALDEIIKAAIPEADKDQYTETSWKAYAEALKAAKKVQADKDAVQQEIDEAVKALEDAKKALVKIDKTALDEAIKTAIPESDKDKYTESTWSDYERALNNAKGVQADKDATQKEIDDAVKALEDAQKALKEFEEPEPVDKSALDEAIKAAIPETDKDKYTVSSWNDYAKALKAAKEVQADKDATQKDVDNALKTLEDAKKALEEVQPVDKIFIDVEDYDWFAENVQYVYDNGYMTGLSENVFGPEVALSRAHFATILYRIEGEPDVEYSETFADVLPDQFYTNPVIWASSKEVGVIAGYENGNFGPADIITREQFATMMYRYAAYKGYDTKAADDLKAFPDAGSVSPFALDAVKWAVAEGLIKGDNGNINPQGEANRAECATIIYRFMENVAK